MIVQAAGRTLPNDTVISLVRRLREFTTVFPQIIDAILADWETERAAPDA